MNWRGNGSMGGFAVEMTLTNNHDLHLAQAGALAPEQVRRLITKGTVDSGAHYLVLPATLATQLGVPSGGDVTVHYADRRSAKRSLVEEVHLELLGRHGTFRAVVEPDRDIPLIGAIVLEDLDLLVDCTKQILMPRDPTGIVAEIE